MTLELRFWLLIGISVLTLAMLGCSVSTGGYFVEGGPHPWVNVAVAARVGPVEVLHAPLGNASPVSDLTRVSVNYGPTYGKWNPTVGLGYAGFRTWGACNDTGYWCDHEWVSSFTIGAGLTYRYNSARADVGAHCFDGNAPISCAGTLMLGVDFP